MLIPPLDVAVAPILEMIVHGEIRPDRQLVDGTDTCMHVPIASTSALESNVIMECERLGTQQNLVLERVSGMTPQEEIAYARMKAFCSNIIKRLAPPSSRKFKAPP